MVTSRAALTAPELELREQVRRFLAETLPWGTFEPGLGMGAAVDRAFFAALAERGWVGMAVPARYGSRDATAVDRLRVLNLLSQNPARRAGQGPGADSASLLR